MFVFGLIALLGIAHAETPKKKTEKTEESKTSKKSSGSKSSSKSSPKSKKSTKAVPKKKPATKSSSKTSKPVVKKPAPKKNPNKPPPKQTSKQSTPNPTGKTKTVGTPAKQRPGKEQAQGNAHKPLGSQTTTNRPSYNRAPNNVDRPKVGKEQNNTPNAHSPIGNNGGHRNPTYDRAPDNVDRPGVGKEQNNTPNAHSPIGNNGGHRNPTYDRAPDNVKRPGVGKERDNTPTAHQPIGGQTKRPERTRPDREVDQPRNGRVDRQPPTKKESNRPEKGRPNRESDGRIDREPPTKKESNRPQKERPNREVDQPRNGRVDRQPPTKKESNRPEKGRPNRESDGRIDREPPTKKGSNRPSRSNGISNTPNKKVDRTASNPGRSTQPSQAVSPGKSRHRNAYNGGFNTSTRQRTTTKHGDRATGDWGIGLGTLSFASDYVDGGDYQDGGLGMSVGFRIIPQFEIEGSYGQYTDSTLEASRNRLNRPIQLVGQVHPLPNSVVSPFVSGGYVWNNVVIDDEYIAAGENKSAEQQGWLTGLALGAGVTFNVHQNIALELDGRLFQYNNLTYSDDAGDTATLVSMGVVVGF